MAAWSSAVATAPANCSATKLATLPRVGANRLAISTGIGVTTAQIGAGFGRAQNLNLAVPVNDLKKLIRSEYPQKRKFGESSSSSW